MHRTLFELSGINGEFAVTLVEIEKIHQESDSEIQKLIRVDQKLTIQIPLYSINSTNSYVDIIIDYIEASYIAEKIAEFSKRAGITIKHDLFHYPVVHLCIIPQDHKKLADLLTELSLGFSGEDDDTRESFLSYADRHQNELEEKQFVYPELVDEYYANLVSGAYNELPAYAEEQFEKYPERKFGFWKSPVCKNKGYEVFVSNTYTGLWFMDRELSIPEVLKSCEGIDDIQFEPAKHFVINNKSYLINKFNLIYFPIGSFLKAKLCIDVVFKKWNQDLALPYNNVERWYSYTGFDRELDSIFDKFGVAKTIYNTETEYYISNFGNTVLIKDGEFQFFFWYPEKLNQQERFKLIELLGELLSGANEITGLKVELACPWEEMDDELFEELCYDIIYHNPKFDNSTIRKMGKSRSRDGGRDIVVYSKSRSGQKSQKWIFQCKYLKPGNSLTATKVINISDIVEQYGAHGYGIMTSVVIDATMYDKLDAIAIRKEISTEEYSVYELERLLAQNSVMKERHF